MNGLELTSEMNDLLGRFFDKLTKIEQLEFDRDRINHEIDSLVKIVDDIEDEISKLNKEENYNEQLSKFERLEKEKDQKAERAYSDWKYGSNRE